MSEGKILVPEEVNKVLRQIIGPKQSIMSSALARIFTARSEGQWIYSNLQGILCLIWDREKDNIPFIRLFDVETFDLLFEAEIYMDFHHSFTSMSSTFYFFEFTSAFIGLQFANQAEAQAFSLKVITTSIDISQQQEESAPVKEKDKSIIAKSADKFLSFFKKTKKVYPLETISKPTNFKHENCLQFDFQTNQFNFSNLDEYWNQVFQRAGISRADLSNEILAPIIFESVMKFQAHFEQQILLPNSGSFPQTFKSESIPSKEPIVMEPSNNEPTVLNSSQQTQTLGSNQPTNPNIIQSPQIIIPIAPQLIIPAAPLLNIPIAPQLNILMNSSNAAQSTSAEKSNLNKSRVENNISMVDQIRMKDFSLKPVVQQQQKASVDISSMDGKTQENLSMYLSRCIAERRKQLRKNHYSSSENSSSEDDDDLY